MIPAYRDLPPELLDAIFHELKSSALTKGLPDRRRYVEAIHSCMLVCKAFRRRALPILYQHITITNDSQGHGQSKHLETLKDIFFPPPEIKLEGIGRYVESVAIGLSVPHISIFSPPSKHLSELKEFLGDPNLIAVINGLHGPDYGIKDLVVNLVMSRNGRASCGTKWAELDTHFCTALEALAHSPRLNYLWISDIHHLPLTLLNTSRVQNLRFHHSILGQPVALFSHPGQELPYPILEAVYSDHSNASGSQQLVNGLKAPNRVFERLTEFTSLSHGQDQIQKAWRIIGTAAQTLETISIEHCGVLTRPPNSFCLNRMPNLVSFSFSHQNIPYFDDKKAVTDLKKIYTILKVEEPMKRLQILNLKLQCHRTGVPKETFDPEIVFQWQQFDQLLSGPNYVSIRQISIKIFVALMVEFVEDVDSKDFIELVTLQLGSCFDRLSRSKTVSFEILVDTLVEAVAY